MKMEYEIITAFAHYELAKRVNEYLLEGWELHGNTVMDKVRFYQAMIRKTKTDEK